MTVDQATRSHSLNIAQISNTDWIKLNPLNLALVFYIAMLGTSRYAYALFPKLLKFPTLTGLS
ncbi:MAG: hypothetical protein F6K37_36110 [Moorea sp. SIO4E2]|uniref:hypothetical protein n=1 Tax=Moorena sp. SIO4E2 TaxID=2607826 RepID=UPI0013BA65E8|nr:hypothetical protein [Moorena sp. SIO4E2]NEQ11136.1 hypothetical protein [Moorena sp. SIO4E2]